MNRPALALALVLSFAVSASAQTRFGIGYGASGDGSCPVAAQTLVLEFSGQSDTYDVAGRTRIAPSGGDCRVRSQSYAFSAERFWDAGWVDLALEAGAKRQTLFSRYDIENPRRRGHPLLRPDGQPAFTANLPVGSPTVYAAVIGVSRAVGDARVGLGANLAPVRWTFHDRGPTVRLSGGYDLGPIGADFALDHGADQFGEASVSYRAPFSRSYRGLDDVVMSGVYRWGLGAIAPWGDASQAFSHDSFIRSGADAQDHSWQFNLTFGLSR